MKIGRLQVVLFKNFMLGPEPDFGKPVNAFYIRWRDQSISINARGYCIIISYHKLPKFKKRKPLSDQELKELLKKHCPDPSNLQMVEMSLK